MSEDAKFTAPGVPDPARVTYVGDTVLRPMNHRAMRCLPASLPDDSGAANGDACWVAGLREFTSDPAAVFGGWVHDADGVWRWRSRTEAGPDASLWVPGDAVRRPPTLQRSSAAELPSERSPAGAHWRWRVGDVGWVRASPASEPRIGSQNRDSVPSAEDVVRWMRSDDPDLQRRGGRYVYSLDRNSEVSNKEDWRHAFVACHGMGAFLQSQRPRDFDLHGKDVISSLRLPKLPKLDGRTWQTAFEDAIGATCPWPVAGLLWSWIRSEEMLQYVRHPTRLTRLTQTVVERAVTPHTAGDASPRVRDLADLASLAAHETTSLSECARALDSALHIHFKDVSAGCSEVDALGRRLFERGDDRSQVIRNQTFVPVQQALVPVLRNHLPKYIESVFDPRSRLSHSEVAWHSRHIGWADDAGQFVFSKEQALSVVDRYLTRADGLEDLSHYRSYFKWVHDALRAHPAGAEIWRDLESARTRLRRKVAQRKKPWKMERDHSYRSGVLELDHALKSSDLTRKLSQW